MANDKASGNHPSPEELQRWAEHQLTEADRQKLEAHLVNCPECLNYLEIQAENNQSIRSMLGMGSTSGQAPSAVAPARGWQEASRTEEEIPAIPIAAFVNQRYKPEEFHAMGGLGYVFRGRDEEIGRDVAIKRMKKEKTSAVSREHFLREVEITGRLEHPNVPAIYGKGVDDEGLPFYAMRFIEGKNMAAGVEEFHSRFVEHGLAGEYNLEFRKLIGSFVVACTAVAHAHNRGIIHRDLKPHNIMLGKDGDTFVVDWGMGKVLGLEETIPNSRDLQEPTSPTSPVLTELGKGKGTEAYISPEQARGEWNKVSPASDQFSLGATLYHLLTGQPPYRSKLGIFEGSFPPPRAVKPSVPKPLEAICRKAMNKDPASRYPSVKELAEDVQRWLADEPIRVYPEPWTKRAGRWMKRHRLAVTSLAAAVAMLTVGLSIGGWAYWQNRADYEAKIELQLERGLAKALSYQEQAAALPPTGLRGWQDKENLLSQALKTVEEARSSLLENNTLTPSRDNRTLHLNTEIEVQLAEATRQRRLYQRLDEAFELRGRITDSDYNATGKRLIAFGNSGGAAYAEAFREYGADVLNVETSASLKVLVDSPIRDRIADAMTDWLVVWHDRPEAKRLLEFAQALDSDDNRTRLRLALVNGDRQMAIDMAGELDVEKLSLTTILPLGDGLQRLGEFDQAILLLRKAHKFHPRDFWINNSLGALVSVQHSRQHEALEFLQTAHFLRPDVPIVCSNLAANFMIEGDLKEAKNYSDLALQKDPSDFIARMRRAEILAASKEFEKAKEICHDHLRTNPGSTLAYIVLGNVLMLNDDFPGAKEAAKKAIEKSPEDFWAMVCFSKALLHAKEFAEAINVGEKLKKEFPKRPEGYLIAALGHGKLGNVKGYLTELRKGNEIAPTSQDILSALCIVHLKENEIDRGEFYFQSLMRLPPSNLRTSCLRRIAGTHLLEKNKLLDEAAQLYCDLLSAEPKNEQTRNQLKKVLSNPRQIQRAQGMLATVVSKLAPNEREKWQRFWQDVEKKTMP